MTNLKPCPFCGGEAEIKELSDASSAIYYEARCKKCNVNVIVYADMTKSIGWNNKEVIEKWNTRLNPWHTGTPTEEGWYLLAFKYGDEDSRTFYEVLKWEGVWKDKDIGWDALKVFDLAWMPITPYEEKDK